MPAAAAAAAAAPARRPPAKMADRLTPTATAAAAAAVAQRTRTRRMTLGERDGRSSWDKLPLVDEVAMGWLL